LRYGQLAPIFGKRWEIKEQGDAWHVRETDLIRNRLKTLKEMLK
jgi:hypothetical protein